MKETKDVAPSVVVYIVTGSGEDEVAVVELRNGTRTYVKKAIAKNILPEAGMPAPLGTALAPVTPSQYHKIQQAVRFITDNYRTDIRLSAVARQAGMSPSHFSRIFKKAMGVCYQGYLNSCRITKAKDLLRTSPQSISEIAASLGFSDATGFGRIFKKITGQTPSDYRSFPR
jgi:AraC-like DNA-binding protein